MSFWKSTKIASIYTLYFIFIFIFTFIEFATDGAPTTGMFIIISVGISLLIILFFGICRALLKFNKQNNVLIDSLILYLLAEISFLCISGELSFFGVLHIFHLNDELRYPILNLFREKTELVFSLSSFISAFLFSIQRIYITKNRGC
ncbi:hypothetical protein [Mucilaginibacter sp. 3215]|uniref:hypothetical protein n=1 Tax=Mucilaginibacter sp. 3215 TaxID=3373912 RepID=UPI003D19E6D4